MLERRPSRTVVVVVEDDPAVLNSLEFSLEAQGYEVLAFECAVDALKSPRLPDASCMVIDYALPDVNGVALLNQLRLRGVTSPAVIIASNPSQRCHREAQAAGAPVIEKPLMGDILSEHIRSVI